MVDECTFSSKFRVRKSWEYEAVFNNGRSFSNKFLKILFLENGGANSRLGLVVSKRHGNAPHRNKIKRFLRESFRVNKDVIMNSTDIVIIPRASIKDWSLQRCRDSYLSLVQRYNGSSSSSSSH